MAGVSTSGAPPVQQIVLDRLNLQQLTVLKQQFDQELNVLQDSWQTLKIAQTRFQESGSCLDKITPTVEGKEILVPLTGSMYVPGKLSDTKNVLVDVGTGYYAKKEVEDAKDYFNRRVAYVTEQMEKIQQLGEEKSKIRDDTVNLIEMRKVELAKKMRP